jgi:hypothetical protein
MAFQEINAIHRTTLQPVSAVDPNTLDGAVYLLYPDLNIVNNVDRAYWKIVNDQLVEMDTYEKSVVDQARLPELKLAKAEEVDRRTQQLIEGGFTHDSVEFSLSENAQKNWNRLYSMLLSGTLVYPVSVSAKDISVLYELADAAAVTAFYTAMNTTIESHLQSGRNLKAQIFAATTKAELDAIVDPR